MYAVMQEDVMTMGVRSSTKAEILNNVLAEARKSGSVLDLVQAFVNYSGKYLHVNLMCDPHRHIRIGISDTETCVSSQYASGNACLRRPKPNWMIQQGPMVF
jgi:hypothetical protein